jgi:hypothetical protein
MDRLSVPGRGTSITRIVLGLIVALLGIAASNWALFGVGLFITARSALALRWKQRASETAAEAGELPAYASSGIPDFDRLKEWQKAVVVLAVVGVVAVAMALLSG